MGEGLVRYSEFVNRIDVDQLEEELGFDPITQSGSEDRGYCFDIWGLHKNGDTTGKLAINRDKMVYNCWVCGGGSILHLVTALKGWGVEEATEWLYQFTRPPSQSKADFLVEIDSKLKVEDHQPTAMPYFNEAVLNRWQETHPWFDERRISDEVRTEFRVGFNPAALKFNKEGSYTGPAIVLPHFWKDRLVGWQLRFLDEDRPKWVPKYDNTTDFPKSTVWGLDFARKVKDPPIVVESVPTALYLLSEGHSAIATFGGGIKAEQMAYLRGFQQGVILAPDNDEVGRKWLHTQAEYLERFTVVYKVPTVDGEGADLGDLTPDELEKHLARRTYVS